MFKAIQRGERSVEARLAEDIEVHSGDVSLKTVGDAVWCVKAVKRVVSID